MAAYEHLPIYKKMMDLAVFMEHTASYFPREHKYTLGAELRAMCHEGIGLIMDANSMPVAVPRSASVHACCTHCTAVAGRKEVLIKFRALLERLKVHLVLAREVRAFHNKNSFSVATEMAVDVSRQNEGWIKSTARAQSQGVSGSEARERLSGAAPDTGKAMSRGRESSS